MDILQIVYIIVALICGLLIMWLLMRNKNTDSSSEAMLDSSNTNRLQDRVNSLEAELSKAKTDYSELETKYSDNKKKYEELLDKANKKISELNGAISLSSDKTSDTIVANSDSAANADFEAKLKKLKKEVDDLEEELEEAEDNLEGEKKKLRRKSEECDELQKENDEQLKVLKKKEHEIEDLNSSIVAVRQELKDKVNELDARTNSIRFVQEVLTADRVKASDVQALSKQIDKIIDFVQGELRDNINRWKTIKNEKFFHEDVERWASMRKKTWLRHKTTIAFVGEFSAGKTSIVNRILSQDDESVPKLPVSTKATTAIPTYVTGGSLDKPQFAFLTPDNILKEIKKETFEIVSKEVLDQVKGVSSLIKYFVMKYKNDNLKSLSILDTPGFNSNDSEDAIRTIEVINECDALFWVFDVNNGTVNRSSIKVIKDNLTKPLYIVINKIDSKAPSEVDKVEDLIKKQLAADGLTVQEFIRFSSDAELDAIMKPIKSIQKIEEEEYIDLLHKKVDASVRSLDKEWKEARQTNNLKTQKVAILAKNFRNVMSVLSDDCTVAKDIPYYDPEHGFLNLRDPNYKISVEQKEEFDKILDRIGEDHLDKLKKIFNQQELAVKEQQESYSDFKIKQGLYNMLEGTKNKLDKLIAQLN